MSTSKCFCGGSRQTIPITPNLENLVSDRALIRASQLRLDILYFLDYAVGQPGAPSHFPGTAPFPAPDNAYRLLCFKLALSGYFPCVWMQGWSVGIRRRSIPLMF